MQYMLWMAFDFSEETMKYCPQGHSHTPENRFQPKNKKWTECLLCHRARARKYNAQRVFVYEKPDQVALDRGHTEDNIGAFLVLADVLKSERVKQGTLATVGMVKGVSPISLGERERGLKNKLKAVARFADLLGLEVSFSIRRKNV